MEQANEFIEARMQEIRELESVLSDKRSKKSKQPDMVSLEGEVKEIFVGTVTTGLRINQNSYDYYLKMGRLLWEIGPKLKELQIYGATCKALGLKKSTANNIVRLYEWFGEQVGNMISLIPVRKLLVVCAHTDLTGQALIDYCVSIADEIQGREGVVLRAWVKKEPEPVKTKPEEVGSFTIDKSPGGKVITIRLKESNVDVQGSVADFLKDHLARYGTWKKNHQSVGHRVIPEEVGGEPEVQEMEATAHVEDVEALDKVAVEEQPSAEAQAEEPYSPIEDSEPSEEDAEDEDEEHVEDACDEFDRPFTDCDGDPDAEDHMAACS